MVKIFESKLFNILLPVIFFASLVLVYFFGRILEISDVPTLIANSIFLLMATLIAISLPLYATFKNEQKRKDEEQKMVYVSVSRYVGNEIIDNSIAIEDLLANNKKSETELTTVPKSEKNRVLAGLWSASAEEMEVSLDDKWHQSMVSSGLVAKIQNDEVSDSIRDVYQKMDNLIKQLRRMGKFCNMSLNSQHDLPEPVVEYMLNTKLLEGISTTERDIAIFLENAKKTVDVINKFLKPYGKKLEVFTYADAQ